MAGFAPHTLLLSTPRPRRAGKRGLQAPCLALLLLAAVSAAPRAAHACTSIIVGRNASTDGSIIIARNVDMAPGVFQPQALVYHPFRAGNATFRSNSNKLAMALPAPGVAYQAFPLIPASMSKWGIPSFEEAGVNVYGACAAPTRRGDPALLCTCCGREALPPTCCSAGGLAAGWPCPQAAVQRRAMHWGQVDMYASHQVVPTCAGVSISATETIMSHPKATAADPPNTKTGVRGLPLLPLRWQHRMGACKCQAARPPAAGQALYAGRPRG